MSLKNLVIKISLKEFFSKKKIFFSKNKNGIIIVKNAVNKKKIRNILRKILKSKKNYVKKPLIVEGVKNVCWTPNFKVEKLKKKQYATIGKSWYFFPWNKDKTGIVKITSSIFKRVNELNGYDDNKVQKNTPKDKIIKRIQVIFYPHGTGLISLHKDPVNVIKITAGIYVTEYNTDYDKGGFYIIKNKKKYFLDHFVKAGDLVLFRPSIIHAVDPVYKSKPHSKNIFKGRIFLNLSLVQSHEVKKRTYSVGV